LRAARVRRWTLPKAESMIPLGRSFVGHAVGDAGNDYLEADRLSVRG